MRYTQMEIKSSFYDFLYHRQNLVMVFFFIHQKIFFWKQNKNIWKRALWKVKKQNHIRIYCMPKFCWTIYLIFFLFFVSDMINTIFSLFFLLWKQSHFQSNIKATFSRGYFYTIRQKKRFSLFSHNSQSKAFVFIGEFFCTIYFTQQFII